MERLVPRGAVEDVGSPMVREHLKALDGHVIARGHEVFAVPTGSCDLETSCKGNISGSSEKYACYRYARTPPSRHFLYAVLCAPAEIYLPISVGLSIGLANCCGDQDLWAVEPISVPLSSSACRRGGHDLASLPWPLARCV